MLLRKLIIFDYSNELAFFEAKQRGVICGGEEDGSAIHMEYHRAAPTYGDNRAIWRLTLCFGFPQGHGEPRPLC